MSNSTLLAGAVGAALSLGLVAGFVALDRTTLHWYADDAGSEEQVAGADEAAIPTTSQPTARRIAAVEDTPTMAPPTRPLDRRDCAAIRGTEYRSTAEREWFIANCLPPTSTPAPPATSVPLPPQPSGITAVQAIDIAVAWMNAEDTIWPYSKYFWAESLCSANPSTVQSQIPSGDTRAWRVGCSGESADHNNCPSSMCSVDAAVCVFDPSGMVLPAATATCL